MIGGILTAMSVDRKDFFVGHAGADRPWAERVAWQLTDVGYTVGLGARDWPAGQNFLLAMNGALEHNLAAGLGRPRRDRW